jgi:hypothetical protein
MQSSPGPQAKHPKISSRYLQVIDSLLIAGIKLGPSAKRKAIDKILQTVPQLTRGECWQRIRYLRKTPALATVEVTQPNTGTSKPRKNNSTKRATPRSWTDADEDKLLTLVGYERIDKIAQRLDRSAGAVRSHVGALGMSAKLKDGWSLRSLRNMLRISNTRLRVLIGKGILRVRDPRISASSLALLWEKNRSMFQPAANERVAAALQKEDEGFIWERAADLLGVTVADVQNWICKGQLKVADTFVTERCFEEFCKKHGEQINRALIDADVRKWLIDEYGLSGPVDDSPVVSRAQKHALTIRTCECGKKIAGNVYFRHVRPCAVMSAGRGEKRYETTSPSLTSI